MLSIVLWLFRGSHKCVAHSDRHNTRTLDYFVTFCDNQDQELLCHLSSLVFELSFEVCELLFSTPFFSTNTPSHLWWLFSELRRLQFSFVFWDLASCLQAEISPVSALQQVRVLVTLPFCLHAFLKVQLGTQLSVGKLCKSIRYFTKKKKRPKKLTLNITPRMESVFENLSATSV